MMSEITDSRTLASMLFAPTGAITETHFKHVSVSCFRSLHTEVTELLTLLGSPFFLSTISVTSHEAHLLELMAAMTVSKDWPSALRSTSAPQ